MNYHTSSARGWLGLGLFLTASLAVGSHAASPATIEAKVRDDIRTQGHAQFWVVLREQADLTPAFQIKDWKARGNFVYSQLVGAATRTQPALRAALQQRNVPHNPVWIVNAVQVTGDQATLDAVAARPEVGRILATRTYSIPTPLAGTPQSRVNGVEWNIDRIRAPEVWAAFGRGEGIVVCNIDTGVQFDHPALVNQYRGNLGGGSFDHNYNWYDPSGICALPSLEPCDNVGHGTHTMGTMVGDDGMDNQIGVAPGARWIAAKGCEYNSCSGEALTACAEWILAPTDLTGANPRPDLRPHVVNNSWGGGQGDPWYQALVQAWIAAGIFPAFSIGNSGEWGCGSANSPGDYPESYASGAFDINDTNAWFSSRGPSYFTDPSGANLIKPNIAAPGVDVRSSVPGNGYDWYSGTSMASPHTAATVALIWSAAPALVGDIDNTRALLDQTAVDTPNLSCGGTDQNNNIWGEGKLDAFAAVDFAPKGPTGTLEGTVTDAASSLPLPGVRVEAVGPSNRAVSTDPGGFYRFPVLPVGTYDVTVRLFAYLPHTVAGVAVEEEITTVQDFALTPAPAHRVSGYVYEDDGKPVPNATVTVLGTPIPPAVTGPDGAYAFASVPEGTYDVLAAAGGCNDPLTQPLTVAGPVADFNFLLPLRVDAFGYYCRVVPFDYLEADNVLPLYYNWSYVQVDLPFPFTLYGKTYRTGWVSTGGFLTFFPDAAYAQWHEPIPTPWAPNAAVYAFWGDLYVDPWNYPEGSVRTRFIDGSPKQFVIEWRNVRVLAGAWDKVLDVEIVLQENGRILTQYRNVPPDPLYKGQVQTIGLENENGTVAFQYSYDQSAIGDPEFAVLYRIPPSAFLEGYVTDAAEGQPIAGALVRVSQAGVVVREEKTDAAGFYRLQTRLGTGYLVEASAKGYETASSTLDLSEEDAAYTVNFALRSPRARLTPASLEFLLPAGATRSVQLTLQNVGLVDLTFAVGELPVVATAPASGLTALADASDSRTAPAGYVATRVRGVLSGGPTLVFMDAYPWGSDALFQVLSANGIAFDVANSWQMGSLDLSPYEAVFLSNDQPWDFYANYNANLVRFEAYVETGGFLWVGAAAWGWNGGDFNGGVLPGGARVLGPVFEDYNTITDPAHPVVEGVPNPFYGSSASHAAFDNVPGGAQVIARGQSTGLPTLLEYPVGAGRVLALGQTLEFAYMYGQDAGRILKNGVPYAYAFEPVLDIPWLAEEPTAGTVAPGTSQSIRVTVDTTGLAPGVYKARLVLRTNDPRNPRLEVPVTLLVPAYFVGVNSGGGAYADRAGDAWYADKAFASSGWGYIGKSQTQITKKAIGGTDDDPLYQDARSGAFDYRFDVPVAGIYDIELHFAEIQNVKAGQRQFDVILEGANVLPAHDIAAEVGSFVADQHRYRLRITDGQVNLRFVIRRSFKDPVVNAIRVIHRPDL